MIRIRTASLLVTIALVVAAVPTAGLAQPAAPGVASTNGQFESMGNHTDAEVSPGERLAGVIGVHEAELEGEVERRAFGIEIARVATNESKAGVVKEKMGSIQQRLVELKERKAELQQARDNGEITEGEYRAQLAEVAARTETVKQLADASEARANELPTSVLESVGVNVNAIQTLKQSAEELSGPEVAEIAKSIAGPGIGEEIAGGKAPVNVGAPDDGNGAGAGEGASADRAERTMDRAESRLEQAREQINHAESQVEDGTEAADALADAKEELSATEKALADAEQALETEEYETALELAEQALEHAQAAVEGAQQTLEEAGSGQTGSDTGGTGQDGSSTDGGSQSGSDTGTATGSQGGQ